MPRPAEHQRPKRESLNLRIPPQARELIDQAARVVSKNRTEFILVASYRAADDALLDCALLRVDEAVFAAFQSRLDAPAAPSDRLLRTMQSTPPWDQG